jgi:fatty-acid desaturase
METMSKYGSGTPDDWIERNLYTRFSWQGVGLMLIINLALFGAAGLIVWAVQMAWIPVMATGIINGIGHYWGYRNFEAPDASTNMSIWGIIIGGEELHNNHHTYPTSASVLGQAVRVRHRLDLHQPDGENRLGQGQEDSRPSCSWAPSSPWPTKRRWKR